jgi:hypothetical protein
MDFKETVCEGVDWVRLAQDKDQWRALVNIVGAGLITLQVPQKIWNVPS